MSKPRKKIIVVIFEGETDRDAFEVILGRYFDPTLIRVKVIGGDITLRNNCRNEPILKVLGNAVKKFLTDYPLRKKDILKIVHLIDMDGAYIPNDRIVERPGVQPPIYTDETIETAFKENLETRNLTKRQSIDKLCQAESIAGIPYAVYYMSCNLEHIIAGKQNCTTNEKIHIAEAFADKYKDAIDDFVAFIKSPPYAVISSYPESWQFIKGATNSLKRYTNFGLVFDK